jgi:hypothetical protein
MVVLCNTGMRPKAAEIKHKKDQIYKLTYKFVSQTISVLLPYFPCTLKRSSLRKCGSKFLICG